MLGQRLARMEIFLVGGNPIGRNFPLRYRQTQTAVANHLPKPIFQRVFHVRVPCGRVGVRPEIVNIFGAPERGRDEVVHFIGSRISPGNPVFLKDLPLDCDGNGLIPVTRP